MSIVTFSINADIPAEKQAEILQKVTDYLGYEEGTTPGTRKAYLEAKLKAHIKEIYNTVRANEGAVAGRDTALAEADGEIV